jgi:hypothetical protein
MYEIDVHFYMTLYIANAIGLGDVNSGYKRENGSSYSAAYVIAWANQYTDQNSHTEPLQLANVAAGTRTAQRIAGACRQNFHFRAYDGEKVEPDEPVTYEPLEKGIKQNDLFMIGIALHAYQDSWSHKGYDASGHAFDKSGWAAQNGMPVLGDWNTYGGHGPDYPWRDVKGAMDMAEATYNWLADYYTNTLGKGAPAQSFEDLRPTIQNLLRQSGRLKSELDRANLEGKGAYDTCYQTETARRESRWLELVGGQSEIYLYEANVDKDIWDKPFLTAAGKVSSPGTRPKIPPPSPGK